MLADYKFRQLEVDVTDAANPTDELGPVDVIVVGFPDGVPHPEGFDALLGLVDNGMIDVLDVEFVVADSNGAHKIPASDFDVAGFDGAMWAGASSGLLDDDDVAEVGADLAAGELAAVVLVEERWMLGVVDNWRSSGARLISGGGVPVQDLIDALEAAEQRD